MQDQLPSSQLWWCLCKPNWAVRPICSWTHHDPSHGHMTHSTEDTVKAHDFMAFVPFC